MAGEIFIHSHNPTSDRLAILEDNETVAFLYLTHKGTQTPERDAIAYMRITPPDSASWKEMAVKGEPPVLSKEYSSTETVIHNPTAEDFTFLWSEDGESAVLVHKDRPIALVTSTRERGYSRSVSKENPLASPWNQQLYDSLFGK